MQSNWNCRTSIIVLLFALTSLQTATAFCQQQSNDSERKRFPFQRRTPEQVDPGMAPGLPLPSDMSAPAGPSRNAQPAPLAPRQSPRSIAPSTRSTSTPVNLTLMAVWSADTAQISELQTAVESANRNELETIAVRLKSAGMSVLLVSAKSLPNKKVQIFSGDKLPEPGNRAMNLNNRNESWLRSTVTLQPTVSGGQIGVAWSIETADQDNRHTLQMESNAPCTERLNDVARVSAGEGHWLIVTRGVVNEETPRAGPQRQPASPRSRSRDGNEQPETPARPREFQHRSSSERQGGDRTGNNDNEVESGRTSGEKTDSTESIAATRFRTYATALIQKYDTDGDHKLSKKELESWRRPPDFQTVDKNRDQLLGAEELANHLANPGSGSTQGNKSRDESQRNPNRDDRGENDSGR